MLLMKKALEHKFFNEISNRLSDLEPIPTNKTTESEKPRPKTPNPQMNYSRKASLTKLTRARNASALKT